MATNEQTGSKTKTWLVSGLLLALAGGITLGIFHSEPEARRGGASKKTAMLVEVVAVEHGRFRPEIVATGTVRAERDIVLSPRVGGQVVWRADFLDPGGFVDEGDVLIRLDPADYQTNLVQRRGELAQAETALRLELGQQDVAKREYEQLFDDSLPRKDRELVLREPQLVAAKAAVDGAKAAVRKARLDLERTVVKAPFDAQVLGREVDVGSLVAAGAPIARLVGVDEYWVEIDVPLAKRRLLSFAEDGESEASPVEIRDRAAWPSGATRSGRLARLVGALDGQTRMARALVSVSDPLVRDDAADEAAQPLLVGQFVEARIQARELSDVVRLDRDYVRRNDTTWVMKDGKLEIRRLAIAARDSTFVYVASGLSDGDQVVTTNLATVTEGAPLRTESQGAKAAERVE